MEEKNDKLFIEDSEELDDETVEKLLIANRNKGNILGSIWGLAKKHGKKFLKAGVAKGASALSKMIGTTEEELLL